MASLNIHIVTHSNESDRIPKKVRILDAGLNEIKALWLRGGSKTVLDVKPGLYAIVLTLPSEKEMEKIIKVENDRDNRVEFNLSEISPHESHEWAYMSKGVVESSLNLVDSTYLGSWIRLWRIRNNMWSLIQLPILDTSSWDEDGVSYTLQVNEELQFLQVGGPKIPWRLIALPPGGGLKCLIKPNMGPSKMVHPLEITVTSNNWEAEAILTMISNNAIDRATEIYESSYLKDATAETLLQNKMSDPTSAAIGAYYLLKLEKFERLHSWAKNLANWIEWMPDGSIIWAWQMIKEGRRSGQVNIEEVRERLLEACKRGIPIYTEGLRLLWDGLKMLTYEYKDDKHLNKALEMVNAYVDAADWSATVTTFNGKHPANPSNKSRKGTPRDTTHLAYIYDVPAKSLAKSAGLSPEDTIELITPLSGTKSMKIARDGSIEFDDGNKFKTIYDAAKKIRTQTGNLKNISKSSSDIDWEGMSIKNNKLDLSDEIRSLRLGSKDWEL